ncbi:hypothetical protein Ddye_004766 [Dipteronia dyeriana]|uniref:Reverse transcriptase domain-containing protein n=1 Tax=Dipteronia dyeriana TaxID=168575 RepID=A0AAD9XF44_9ROSI|nr:hypothetical protein Ddye_004766 [Dipteronia dyeriana]
MKTRNGKSLERQTSERLGELFGNQEWTLELEVAKVIEKGVELGSLKPNDVQNQRISVVDRDVIKSGTVGNKQVVWDLDNKVNKIIETGVALGFDFNGEEDGVRKEIVRREEEDAEKYAAVNALSWNVRGLGSVEKRRVVRNLVRKHKPMMLFIQESKLKSFDYRVITTVGGSVLSRGIGVYAKGVGKEHVSRMIVASSCREFSLNFKRRWCFVTFMRQTEKKRGKPFGTLFLMLKPLFLDPILDPSERKDGLCSVGSMRNFNAFIVAAKLVDMPLQGLNFTWSNNRVVELWVRLDRFLCSPIFLSWFPQLVQICLNKSFSDHNPIAIEVKMEDWGPRPFRFCDGLLEEKSLMENIANRWRECIRGESKGSLLLSKIKAVKAIMKNWCKVNNQGRNQTKLMEEELARVERKAEIQGWTSSLREDQLVALSNLWKHIRLEERRSRQVSRVRWPKEGERNTRFFHLLSNVRRNKNFIGELMINGRLCPGPNQIREGVFCFFSEHYKKECWKRPSWNGNLAKKLSEVEKDLEVEFTDEEIWAALCDCDGNKASGPDGLNLNFVKTNWEVIKEDFLNFISEFHKEGLVVKHLNSTFIALIPKNDAMMAKMGFGSKWRNWIWWCISTPTLSVLVNGSPTKQFGIQRGLRQGDPLSPFLFNIVVESLGNMLAKANGIEKKKIHSVDWKTVCKSKKNGGLGVGRIFDKGVSLLAKWIWRFGREDSSLWKKVICAKYGLDVKALQWDWQGSNSASSFIKAVGRLWTEGSRSGDLLKKGLQVVVGNGERAKLWDDILYDSFSLKRSFPIIYALARNKLVFQGCVANLDDATNWVKLRVSWWFKSHGSGSNVPITLLLEDSQERCVENRPRKYNRSDEWKPPQHDDLMFNVDGSARGSPGWAGVMDSISAEISAILKACHLVGTNQSLVNRKVIIVNDSKTEVSWINGDDFGSLRGT